MNTLMKPGRSNFAPQRRILGSCAHFRRSNGRLQGARLYSVLGLLRFALCWIIAALLGLAEIHAAFPPGVALAYTSPSVSIVPANAQVAVGETINVDIRIANVVDLDYADIKVTFDPDLLEVVDAEPDKSGVQIGVGSFLPNPIVYVNSVVQGVIELELEREEGGSSGGGVLGTISFRGKAEGTSDITIDPGYLALEDPNEVPISADVYNGIIAVLGAQSTSTPGPSPTPTSTPTPGPSPTPTLAPTASPSSTPGPTATPGVAVTPTRTPTPTSIGGVRLRSMQVWPDRSLGVSSGQLEGGSSEAGAQALAFGVTSSAGQTVYARAYLRFPLDVFPPGTEVLNAVLYVYVDSEAGLGPATVGVYRPTANWTAAVSSADPATWPALFPSPIAVSTVQGHMAGSGLAPASLSNGGGSGSLASLAILHRPAPPFDSPLGTPPPSPLSTPAPQGLTALRLGWIEGKWLTWDVTVLARAWVKGETPDYGLALAPAPNPDAGPQEAGDLLLAHWIRADDPATWPYLIVQIAIHPVTPTPTPAPILPYAGGSSGWAGGVVMLLLGIGGLVLLALGLAGRGRRAA